MERPTYVASQLSFKYLAYLRFEKSSAQFFTSIREAIGSK